MDDTTIFDENLCYTCKAIDKCSRLKGINGVLESLESQIFDDWDVNIYFDYIIDFCPKYIHSDINFNEELWGDDDEDE